MLSRPQSRRRELGSVGGEARVLKTLLMVGAASFVAISFATGIRTASLGSSKAAVARTEPQDARPGTFSVSAGRDGHFRVDARIAGKAVPMMVDTGATVVALSYEEGRRLGLVSPGDYFDARMSTANGVTRAKRVTLRDIRIGSVRVEDVDAVVMSQGAMDGSLLGMSFLGRLRRLETARNRLTMER